LRGIGMATEHADYRVYLVVNDDALETSKAKYAK
jgi:hypothetical protein